MGISTLRSQLVKSLLTQNFTLKSQTVLSRNMKEAITPESQNTHHLFEEVRIQVPWGHLAGKWWGPKDVRPIVGLHGWQDNAGTFDTLAPLLPKHIGFLSLDLPGHGLSSRIPDGMFYHSIDFLFIIRLLMKEYEWDKISLLAHSMSSICGFLFSAIYPDKVDMMIGLDALKPHIRSYDKMIKSVSNRVENFLIADERNRERSEPPSYTYDELVEKLHLGTFGSVDREHCCYLLERNIQKSSKFPEKYFFARDSRLKSYNYGLPNQEFNLSLAKRINIPYLFIKSINSSYYEEKKYFYEALEVMKKNPKFEFYKVEGTHHVHLNEPEKISDLINNFINKYRPPTVTSKL